MFNNLIWAIRRGLIRAKQSIDNFLADETFLSIKTELILSATLIVQLTFALTLLGGVAREASALASLNGSRESTEKKLGQVQGNSLQIKKMPQAAENLLERLPGSRDNYSLLEGLNAAAGTSQVSLISVNFLPIKGSNLAGLAEQPVEVRLQGNYEGVLSFISGLEKIQRPVLTESVEYITNDKILTSGVVEAALVLKTFLLDTSQ
jgi:Tfp pilus assembly protein PilO